MKDKEAQLIWETLQLGKGGSDGEACPKCGKVHPINASCGKVHEDNSLDAWNTKMQGEPAQNVTRTGGGSTSQVSSVLNAAADGDFISYLNKIEFDERGAAALVEWLARYNLGAS